MENVAKPVRSYKVTIVGLLGIILGIVLLPISENIDKNYHVFKLIIEHIASIFIAVFTLHLISDWVLKKELLGMFRQQIAYSINRALPTSFKNVKKAGIVDVYEKLNFEKLQEHLALISKTEITFLTMWLPYIPRIKESLVDAVNNRQCSVRILVLDPTSESTILHRATSLKKNGFSAETIKTHITLNRQDLIAAYEEINDSKKDQFKCRYYNEWISVSMYGYGDEILIGHYLINSLATESHFIKIAGKDKNLYKEFHNHFDEVWKRSLRIDTNDMFHHINGENGGTSE